MGEYWSVGCSVFVCSEKGPGIIGNEAKIDDQYLKQLDWPLFCSFQVEISMKWLTKAEVAIAEVFTLVKSAALRSKRATVAQLTLKEHLVF